MPLPATKSLLSIMALFFVLQSLSLFVDGVDIPMLLGGSNANRVLGQGEWYRLGTALFLHGNLPHIFMNGMALLFMGRLLEGGLGPYLFTGAFFLSGVCGSILSFTLNPPQVYSIGASGGIVGLAALALVLLPRGYEKKNLQYNALFFLGFSAIVTFFGWINLDNAAHLGGALGGTVMGFGLRLLKVR